MSSTEIRVGCCGFPESRRQYYRRFRVVEVQQTFYQPPQLKTARAWRAGAPSDFEFTMKAWQLITHETSSPTYRRLRTNLTEPQKAGCGSFKPTEVCFWAWEQTLAVAKVLEASIVVFQCPASFKPTEANLANIRRFFQSIRREHLVMAWEPRGNWPHAVVRELCRELDLIHCVDPLAADPLFGRWKYFRLHGRTGYHYRYTSADLRQLLGKCAGVGHTYCMFNNVGMREDAGRLLRMSKRGRRSGRVG